MGRWWRYKWITFHPSLTTGAQTLFKGFAVIDQDFMSVEEVLNYLIKAKSNNASFPVSYFNLFCSGLTNICRSLYFGMDVAITVAGVRLENGNYPTLRLFFVQSGIDCT